MDKKVYTKRQVKIFAKDFVNYLKTQHGLKIKTAFLFGSHAKGTAHPDSDVDVAIISEKFNRVNPLFYLWSKRRDIDIERGIEPYGLSPGGFVDANPVASQIKKFGVLLK